jgi:hypothetical protein
MFLAYVPDTLGVEFTALDNRWKQVKVVNSGDSLPEIPNGTTEYWEARGNDFNWIGVAVYEVGF